jgi:Putative DNA-binding domain
MASTQRLTRRRVNSRILRFSLWMGLAAAFLAAFVFIADAYPAARLWKDINLRTLSEISCSGATCDTSVYTTDWQLSGSDYVVDAQTRYLIDVPTSSAGNLVRFTPLDYSDTAFIARFRQPGSYSTPDGEIWRMYSRDANVGGKQFEIFIGYAEKAPWKVIDTQPSQVGTVDAALRRDADRIAASLPSLGGAVRAARSALSADGFEVVDAASKQVVEWGPWLPAFLPQGTPLPTPGWQIYRDGADLYLVETDTNGQLVATSLVPLGTLGWLAGFCVIAFVTVASIARALSMRFLRGYFAVAGIRVPTLDEALRTGENQRVEFKRGLSNDESRAGNAEDELLKSIAAFANTNDGVIFIGIDDAGHVRGLDLGWKEKDRLEGKIRQLARNRIRPTPPLQVTFDAVGGLVVARISVARGEAPAYIIGGVIYLRYGSSDVQAQPEDIGRLVSEYAF